MDNLGGRQYTVKNRFVQMIVIIILLVGVGYVVFQNLSSSKELIREGKTTPDFSLETLDGKQIRLSELSGQGVLINFWATSCTYCLEEMPAIERQYQKYKDQGIEVLGVNIRENYATVSGYVRRLGVTFPILMDRSGEITKQYQVGALPHSIFLAPDGTVKSIYIGEMKEAVIESHFKSILP